MLQKPDLVIFVMNNSISQAAFDQAQAFKQSLAVEAVIVTKGTIMPRKVVLLLRKFQNDWRGNYLELQQQKIQSYLLALANIWMGSKCLTQTICEPSFRYGRLVWIHEKFKEVVPMDQQLELSPKAYRRKFFIEDYVQAISKYI